MPMPNGRHLEDLGKLLDRREAALRAAVEEEMARPGSEHYADLAGSTPDTADEAVADVLTDVENALVARHIAELRDIDAARRRMAEGTYGTCVDCGQEIAYERLLAYPTAKRCARCQTVHERTFEVPATPSV